jgi:hypothetical protein
MQCDEVEIGGRGGGLGFLDAEDAAGGAAQVQADAGLVQGALLEVFALFLVGRSLTLWMIGAAAGPLSIPTRS